MSAYDDKREYVADALQWRRDIRPRKTRFEILTYCRENGHDVGEEMIRRVLKDLLERGIVEEAGKIRKLGSPMTYRWVQDEPRPRDPDCSAVVGWPLDKPHPLRWA